MQLEVYRVDNAHKKQVWEVFRKYHYLNTELHTAANQWVGILNGELVAHTGVIQFPMRKGWKRVHRLVVLPDYQGIGIGTAFIKAIAQYYTDNGYVMNLTTTTPSLVHAMRRSNHWRLIRYGRAKENYSRYSKRYGMKGEHLNNAASTNRITYSFNYKGGADHATKKRTTERNSKR